MFRGRTLDELQKMSYEEFAELLDARARRSLLRMLRSKRHLKFYKKVREAKESGKKIRTHLRDIVITPDMVGLTIGVYNGKEFVDVHIKPEMLGFRLGDFAYTIKEVKHSGPGVGATRSSKYVPIK